MHDDNQLMIMVQQGDNASYEKIVINNRKSAIFFAYSYVQDTYIAEDIVQECFVKIYLERMSYKTLHTFKTFLFTLIRNKCIDYIRKFNARKTVDIDNILEISLCDTPEKIMLQKEKTIEIFQILNRLQDDYKTALYLFAVEEMSYKDIAKIMRKTSPQVKITIYRARMKLKKIYEGVDINEKQ